MYLSYIIPQLCKHFNRFAGSNLSTDPKSPKCIYKISKNFRVENRANGIRPFARSAAFESLQKFPGKNKRHPFGCLCFSWGIGIRSCILQSISIPFSLCFAKCFGHRSKTLHRSVFSLRSNPCKNSPAKTKGTLLGAFVFPGE